MASLPVGTIFVVTLCDIFRWVVEQFSTIVVGLSATDACVCGHHILLQTGHQDSMGMAAIYELMHRVIKIHFRLHW